jgi:hypothetical protein
VGEAVFAKETVGYIQVAQPDDLFAVAREIGTAQADDFSPPKQPTQHHRVRRDDKESEVVFSPEASHFKRQCSAEGTRQQLAAGGRASASGRGHVGDFVGRGEHQKAKPS